MKNQTEDLSEESKTLFVRLRPEEVAQQWDYIKPALVFDAPPTQGDDLGIFNNYLSTCLRGEMQIWRIQKQKEDSLQLLGFMATSIVTDLSGTKNLLINSVYAVQQVMKNGAWEGGIEQLKRFALASGCNKILAFTKSRGIIKKFTDMGGLASHVVLQMEVK